MNETVPGVPGTDPAAPTQEERTWGMIAHLSAFVGWIIPLGSILAPLVVWLTKRDQSRYVAAHALESLNFNITMAIAIGVCVGLVFLLIGIPLLIGLGLYWLVITIVAGIKANEGVMYRYPFTLRLVK
jgi:uncharacterized Tic20 family protein